MSIIAIDPNTVRAQSTERRQSALPGVGFDDVLMAANPVTATSIGLATQSYQPAAVTSMAMSGIASVPGTFGGNSPYYGGSPLASTASPFAPGGYAYGGSNFNAGVSGFGPGGSTGWGGGPTGFNQAYGAGFTADNDYLAKQQLFQEMNDANWEMLVAQVTVNDLSRDFQARSNILKTKSDAEINATRNFRS